MSELGVPKLVSFEALLGDYYQQHYETTRQKIQELWAKETTEALVVFENLDFSASEYGQRATMQIGPTCTYKTVKEVEGKPIGQTPSVFKYPVAYCRKPGVGYLGRTFTDSQRNLLLQVVSRQLALWNGCRQLEQTLGGDADGLQDLVENLCVGLDLAEDFNSPKQLDETLLLAKGLVHAEDSE